MKHTQSGMSLVEILVALVISLFLLGGIIQVYLGNKTAFAFSNALSEIQENGRFALDTITRDLRLARDWGCIRFDSKLIKNHLPSTVGDYSSDIHDFIEGAAVEGEFNTGINGSDTLTIRGSKPSQANVTTPFSDRTSLATTGISTIAADDIVLVTRCGPNNRATEEDFEADIFQVAEVTQDGTTVLTHGQTLSQQYEYDASIKELQTVTYSIENRNDQPVLLRTEFKTEQVLVEGVENLQILYGIGPDDIEINADALGGIGGEGIEDAEVTAVDIGTYGLQFPNQYSSNPAAIDLPKIVSVKIMLLMRSIDNFIAESPQTYTYNGVETKADDRHIRQVFTTTVALRNPLAQRDPE